MLGSELGQDFAIKRDLALGERAHELGVAHAEGLGGSADADLHQATVITLLEFAVAVGVPSSFDRGDLGESNAVLATPHHALGTGQNILAAFDAVGTALNTWHKSGKKGRQEG